MCMCQGTYSPSCVYQHINFNHHQSSMEYLSLCACFVFYDLEDYCFSFFSCHFCFSGHTSLRFSIVQYQANVYTLPDHLLRYGLLWLGSLLPLELPNSITFVFLPLQSRLAILAIHWMFALRLLTLTLSLESSYVTPTISVSSFTPFLNLFCGRPLSLPPGSTIFSILCPIYLHPSSPHVHTI